MKEKLNALLEGQELSEEFSAKLEALIEVAAAEKVEGAVSELKEAHEKEIADLTEAHEAKIAELSEAGAKDIAEKVDSFLNYVVVEWAKDNAEAIDSQIKVEIAEQFMSSLKEAFEGANVVVPEGQDSIVEALEDKVEELTGRLNETVDKNVALSADMVTIQRQVAIKSVCEGLTDTQKERVSALAENLEFGDLERFTIKVQTIREGIESDKVEDKEETSDLVEAENLDEQVQPSSNVADVLKLMG